ncbi:hypothetical protein EMCRGX_G033270 [Ephydatia muelleri]
MITTPGFMSLPLKHSNTGVNYTWECVHSDFLRARARSSQGGKEGEKLLGIKLSGDICMEALSFVGSFGLTVSDSFYQALSAQCHSLPRPHKVKAARKEVNNMVQLSRIPDYMMDRTDTLKSQKYREF